VPLLLLLGPPFFLIIILLSTTLLTKMISLDVQWPLTSQLHGSFSLLEQLVLHYRSDLTQNFRTYTYVCIKPAANLCTNPKFHFFREQVVASPILVHLPLPTYILHLCNCCCRYLSMEPMYLDYQNTEWNCHAIIEFVPKQMHFVSSGD
jgi:hypothetical protein